MKALLGLEIGLETAGVEAQTEADGHRGVALALPAEVTAPLGGQVHNAAVIEGTQAILDGIVLAGGTGLPAEETGRGREAERPPALAYGCIEEIAG